MILNIVLGQNPQMINEMISHIRQAMINDYFAPNAKIEIWGLRYARGVSQGNPNKPKSTKPSNCPRKITQTRDNDKNTNTLLKGFFDLFILARAFGSQCQAYKC
ncbi:MAG: hypothetical protein WBV22_08325, partial [Anaerolineaceae bacterium]